jgi:uncharacterized protein
MMVDVSGAAPADPGAVAAARLAPVSTAERIPSVDVLRGFAVLGILWMNIITFALPYWAYENPTVYGGATGANLSAWLWSAVFVEGKMRAIFSMLFGASLILITSRAKARGAAADVADIYLRRSLWLAVFGLAHAYLFWSGDILFYFGVVGLGLYPFRRLGPRALIVLGLLVLATGAPRAMLETHRLVDLRSQAQAADAATAAGVALTEEQRDAQKGWDEERKWIEPSAEEVTKEVETYRGSYPEILAARAEFVLLGHTVYFYLWMLFDVLGMMLIGMGLMKLGALSAHMSLRTYAWMAAAGFAICVPITWLACQRSMARSFELAQDLLRDSVYDLSRLAGALGYIGLVMLSCRMGMIPRLRARLAAAGQMALSNYLMQTLICSTLFYGYGFGWFGYLERYQILLVAVPIWAFQLWVSPLWLRHFRFGPMEWVWRSLTYWKRQPLRQRVASEPAL